MLSHLQNLTKTAKDLYSRWQQCIPPGDQNNFCVTRLVSRKAEFIPARREEAERTTPPSMISNYPVATIKLKPTSLPKFTGNKCDFHSRKRDWEALQKQGEPTGSKEVKKMHVLNSLDERIV